METSCHLSGFLKCSNTNLSLCMYLITYHTTKLNNEYGQVIGAYHDSMFSFLQFTHFLLPVKLEDCIGGDYTYFCDVNEGYFLNIIII